MIRMKSKILLAGTAAFLLAFTSNAQGIVGKLKQKAANAAEKVLEKKVDEKTGTSSGNSGNDSNSNSGSTGNGNNSSGIKAGQDLCRLLRM
jgi:hypothetical protein